MSSTAKNKLGGQILVITLLVIMIISVIVVGIIIVSTRDSIEAVSNREYEELYNSSETTILQLIDKYGNNTVALAGLLEDFPSTCTQDIIFGGYQCQFTDAETGIVSVCQVRDTGDVEDFELGKDESFTLALAGYRGEIFLNWDGNSALEFGLTYTDGGEVYRIGDIYDAFGQFDSAGNDPLTDAPPPENHAFPFELGISGELNDIKFNVADITGLPPTATTESLVVTVRGGSGVQTIELDVDGSGTFPDQVREFLASSYNPENTVNILASARALIPLYPQVPVIFHYVLGTQGDVIKP